MTKISIILSKEGQSQEGRDTIIRYLTDKGLELTGSGLVTLSFNTSLEILSAVFQSGIDELPEPLPRPPDTIGASGPFKEPEYTIPETLDLLIDHVSITPAARHFQSGD